MNKIISPDLKGVPQTLLLPLIGRAKFSREPYSPICDDKAVELVNSIGYDFEKLLKNKNVRNSTLFWMARAYHFDEAIKSYLEKHPEAVIVNLGCGLDTSFNRVDNGSLTWIDIDLSDVIDLRSKLLPPSNREHYIAKSILDYSWMGDVKEYGQNIFFFAGGLFMYFTSDQVKSILSNMAKQFPDSYLIFDNISPKGLKHANTMLEKSNMKGALLQWSISDAGEIEKRLENIKVMSQHGYFKNINNKFRFPLSYKLVMYFFDIFHKSGIIKLKFQSE